MRVILTVLALCLAMLPLAPLGAAGPSHTVAASDFKWTPAELTIDAGDVVTFELAGGFHTWVSDAGMGSCSLPCTQVFEEQGEFPYHCGVHPSMRGSIIVRGDPAPDLRFGVAVAGQSIDTSDASSAQRVDFTYQLVNAGDLAAAASIVQAQVLLDGAWTTVGERAHDALDAGQSEMGQISWQSDELRIGRFDARLVADATHQVDESLEQNNVANVRAAFLTGALPGVTARVP